MALGFHGVARSFDVNAQSALLSNNTLLHSKNPLLTSNKALRLNPLHRDAEFTANDETGRKSLVVEDDLTVKTTEKLFINDDDMVRYIGKQTAPLQFTGDQSARTVSKHPEICDSVTDSRFYLENLKVIYFP